MSMFNPPDFSEEEMKEFGNMTVSQYASEYLQPTDDEIDSIVYSSGIKTARLDEISSKLKSLDRASVARAMAAKSFPVPDDGISSVMDLAAGQVWKTLTEEAVMINKGLRGEKQNN